MGCRGWAACALLLVAGACGAAAPEGATAGGTPARPAWASMPEMQAREAISAEAGAQFRAGDRDGIERRIEAANAAGERTSSGLWVSGLLYAGVADAIEEPGRAQQADWDALEADFAAWAKDKPSSALARLLLAHVIERRGWQIRGGGYARTVAAGDWAPFKAHLARARDYLVAEQAVTSRLPFHYSTLVDIGLALDSGDDSRLRRDFEAGVQRFPGYYPLYFSMVRHLLPKWSGDAEMLETFANESVERSRATDGDGMYARIYWYASQAGYEDTLFYTSHARWSRMRASFDAVLARYPDQWNLQNYAHFACEAEDVDTLRALMPKIEEPVIPRAWTGHATWEHCRMLAGYLAL